MPSRTKKDDVTKISDDQEILEYYEYVDDAKLDVVKETSEVTKKAYIHSSGGFIRWFGFPAVPVTYMVISSLHHRAGTGHNIFL